MKKLIYLFATAIIALTACTEDTITYIQPIPGDEPSDVVATLAISSPNNWYTSEGDLSGAINYKTIGGEVIIQVDASVGWSYTAENGEWLTITKDEPLSCLILKSQSNKEEQQLTAKITIKAGDKTATIAVAQNAYGTLEIAASKNTFALPACGELSASFTVTSSDENWELETKSCNWMLAERTGNEVKLTFDANADFEDRSTIITLLAGAGGGLLTEKITIAQDRAAKVSSSVATIPFTSTPTKTRDIIVEANYDWEYTISEGGEWLTIKREESTLTISSEVNPEAGSRSAQISIKAGDKKANVAEQIINVSQTGLDLDCLIFALNITNDLRARLPFDKAINATIDWGDGTVETVTSTYPQHVYSDPDYYVVSIKGTVPSLSTSGINISGSNYAQAKMFVELINWGRTGLTSVASACADLENLEKVSTDKTNAFDNITTFANLFKACKVLEQIPEGIFDNAVNAKTFDSAFMNCKVITTAPETLFAKNTKLESINSVFSGCAITALPADLFANNPELLNCNSAFSYLPIRTVPATLFANNPKINDFNATFSYCDKFESVPEDLFVNAPDVTRFRMCFYGTALTEIPEGLFRNSVKCTAFDSAFYGTKITSIPATLFQGRTLVTTFNSCFNRCANLASIPTDLFTNSGAQAKVTTFQNAFNECASLTEVPAGLFDGFTAVTNVSNIFAGCTNLTTIPAGLFATNAGITNFANVFLGCASLTEIPENMLSGLVKVTSFSGLFSNCTKLTTVGPNIINGCAAVTNISSMFKGCTALTSVSADAFAGAPKINSVASLFENCTELSAIPEAIFSRLPAVTSAANAFAGCTALTTVPADLFKGNPLITSFASTFKASGLTSAPTGLFAVHTRVTSYISAFQSCESLASVGVLIGSNASAAKCDLMFANCPVLNAIPQGFFGGLTGVTSFKQTFEECVGLETIPAELFKSCTKVTDYEKCFRNCNALKAIPAAMFGTSTVTVKFNNTFEGCESMTTIATNAFAGLTGSVNMTNTFIKCTAITEIPDELFKTTAVSSYSNTFADCTGITRIGSESINCVKSSSLSSTFTGCTGLEQIHQLAFVNAGSVTNIMSVFAGCSSLKSIPASLFDTMVKLTNVREAFSGCSSLTGESPYTLFEGRKIHLYERNEENKALTGMAIIGYGNSCFKGANQLSDYGQMTDIWKN